MNRVMTCRLPLVLVVLAAVSPRQGSAVEYPGQDPGPASIAIHQDRIEFANQVLSGSWGCSGGGLHGTVVRDQQGGVAWQTTRDLFQVVLADGTTYSSTSLNRVGDISVRPLSPQRDAARLADRSAGKIVEAVLVSADGRLRATWRAIMLDGANYVRQELELTAPQEPLAIREVAWLDENVADAVNMGSVDGSLVAIGPFFLGCEDPMAENRVAAAQEGGTKRWRGAVPTAAHRGPASGRDDFAELRDRRSAAGPTAPSVLVLPGARTRSSVPALPALQLLVRHRVAAVCVERRELSRSDPAVGRSIHSPS